MRYAWAVLLLDVQYPWFQAWQATRRWCTVKSLENWSDIKINVKRKSTEHRYQLGLHSNFLPKSLNFKKSILIFWNPSLHNGWVYNLVGNRQPSSSYALYHLYVLWFHTLATLGDLCHVTDWCSFFSFQAFTISLCSSHENSKSKCLIVLLGGNLSIHLTSDSSVWNSPIPQK